MTGFLRNARKRGAKAAFEESGYGYRSEPFGEVPCVCLRIPTGGGKTLLASHAVVGMAKVWLDSGAPTAPWLTPSETIRSQTLTALQTPGHPYRVALEEAYGQRFQICDLENVAAVLPHDWGRAAVIVVATIQSFRIEETGLRNVYAISEAFEPHFRGLPVCNQLSLAHRDLRSSEFTCNLMYVKPWQGRFAARLASSSVTITLMRYTLWASPFRTINNPVCSNTQSC